MSAASLFSACADAVLPAVVEHVTPGTAASNPGAREASLWRAARAELRMSRTDLLESVNLHYTSDAYSYRELRRYITHLESAARPKAWTRDLSLDRIIAMTLRVSATEIYLRSRGELTDAAATVRISTRVCSCRLRALLDESGLKGFILERELGIDRRVVAAWRHGRAVPTPAEKRALIALANQTTHRKLGPWTFTEVFGPEA